MDITILGPLNTVYQVVFSNNPNNQVTIFFGNNIKSVILDYMNNITTFRASSSSITIYNIIQTITDETKPCCFSEGTKILGLTKQLKEEYRLVQDLMIGDFVKSYLVPMKYIDIEE